MSLKKKISSDYMISVKEKNVASKNILSVIKGEIQNIEKNKKIDELPDSEVIKILNKNLKSLKEMVSVGDEESKLQLVIVESYLPKEMSREEVKDKVSKIVDSGVTNIGGIMKEFNGLQVDRKMVSEVIQEVLS